MNDWSHVLRREIESLQNALRDNMSETRPGVPTTIWEPASSFFMSSLTLVPPIQA